MGDKTINTKPINMANAEIINEICSPIMNLTLLRYHAIADFYTDEPECILVKKKLGDDSIGFNLIFRYRRWVPNNCTYSWSIYAENREWESNDDALILRYVNWNRSKDIEKVKAADRGSVLNNWPDIKIINLFLEPKYVLELKESLLGFDRVLENGIKLNDRKAEEIENTCWFDIEIMRRFNWGQVKTTWNPIKQNKVIEDKIEALRGIMEKLININADQVYQMDLDYYILPDVFKQLIQGKE